MANKKNAQRKGKELESAYRPSIKAIKKETQAQNKAS
jgi:hypothetical protein